jgi:hypothetical protein
MTNCTAVTAIIQTLQQHPVLQISCYIASTAGYTLQDASTTAVQHASCFIPHRCTILHTVVSYRYYLQCSVVPLLHTRKHHSNTKLCNSLVAYCYPSLRTILQHGIEIM